MVEVGEGASKEQSIGYHWVALELFDHANEQLKLAGSGMNRVELNTVNRMLDFGAVMALPNRSQAPIGDTYYQDIDSTKLLRSYYEKGYGTSISAWFYGDQAVPEPASAYVYPKSGYAMFRPDWSADLQLLFDFGKSKFSHGHNDALNLLLFYHGSRLLTDPGGPYIYGSPDSAFFTTARAHNTVVVDGQDYTQGDAQLLASTDTPSYSFVAAAHSKYADLTHTRSLLLLKPDTLVVLDHLESASDSGHTYNLLYHLPPGATTSFAANSALVTAAPTAKMQLQVASSAPLTRSVIAGQTTPEVQGWVTTGLGVKKPAPVLSFAQTAGDAWFATVVKPFAGPLPPVTLNAQHNGTLWQLELGDGDRHWSVALGAGSALPDVVLHAASSD